MNSYEWDVGNIDETTIKNVGKNCLLKYSEFIKEYSSNLRKNSKKFTCNNSIGPIRYLSRRPDEIHQLELITTENTVLSKVIAVISTLITECDRLCEDADQLYFPALLFYGENDINPVEQGESNVNFSKMLPILQETSRYIQRCNTIVTSILHQLCSLYNNSQIIPKVINCDNIHFTPLFEKLADLLTVLLTFDDIIDSQVLLREHWNIYKRMVARVKSNPASFDVTAKTMGELQILLNDIDSTVFSCFCFQKCITSHFDEGALNVTKNTSLCEEFLYNIKVMLSRLSADDTTSISKVIPTTALYILYNAIYKQLDNKVTRTLQEIFRKIPGIHLIGTIMWFGSEFLCRHIGSIPKDSNSVTVRHSWLTSNTTNLTRDIEVYTYEISRWMLSMQVKDWSPKIIYNGLIFAQKLRHTIAALFTLHMTLATPISKRTILNICELIEILKAIEICYQRTKLNNTLISYMKKLACTNMTCIRTVIKRLNTSSKYNDSRLDIISSLFLCEKLLAGPCTPARLSLIRITLPIAAQNNVFQESELMTFLYSLDMMDTYCNLSTRVREACDTGFLFWNQELLPTYLSNLVENPAKTYKLKYILRAFEESIPNYNREYFKEKNLIFKTNFTKKLSSQIETNLLIPLSRSIENHLRLQTHLHLKLDKDDPFKSQIANLKHVLLIKPIRIFDYTLDIKAYIEESLDVNFYNLTALALHDWSTYQAIKSQAASFYNLSLIEPCLPNQSLEQGLDVLQLMRNIHVFVSRYHYNLNNQIFIEHSSNNKHLNTINIGHISNSVRTHGIGIVNTTINYTYQFLKKKFFIFSQFMYDEHIKSRLIKDLRLFKESNMNSDSKYPYARADKFNVSIRKLGLNDRGESYLDQFRRLITEIGNSLAYIRLMRSGTLHHCAKSIRFLTNIEDDSATDEYRKQLHEIKDNLQKNFSEGTNYFQLLVKVFTKEFCSNKNAHLRNFYIILPALTLNYVEYMIQSKDKLTRSNKEGAVFTEDGFAIGVAYILTLLKQFMNFESLNWFQSINDKYSLDKNVAQTKKDSKQTMQLTLKRIDTYETEFDLLYCSLNSAKIFFTDR